MTLLFVRVFFFILCSIIGWYVGIIIERPLLGAEVGALSGLLLIFLEGRLQRISLRGLSSMVFGLLLGVFMAKLLSDILALLPLGGFYKSIFRVVLTIIFSYLGAVVAFRGKDEFSIIIPYVRFRRQDSGDDKILLDTSAIIDGRIMDIYKTHFLMGQLLVPRCVLQELQTLSDSADDLKRQKGRRGMDLLQTMQKDPDIELYIHEEELNDEKDVDAKLVRLAKLLDARICTTDFNLCNVAALRSVDILNINALATAVKPVVLSGEDFDVKLVREGKEAGQALAYLEDGTMVVVTDAQQHIGKRIKVRVSSILQTQTGRMIFAKLA